MRAIERSRAADRHADAVQREGVISSQSFQHAMRRSARTHVILGVDLEEAALWAFVEDFGEVLGLEARPGDTPDGG
jgi:hypothetical protein